MTKHRRLSIEPLDSRIVFSVAPQWEQSPTETTPIESVEVCPIVATESIQQPESAPAETVADATASAPLPNDATPTVPFIAESPVESQPTMPETDSAADQAAAVDVVFAGPLPLAESETADVDPLEDGPKAFAATSLTNITPDEQKAIDLCGDDPECRKQVEHLIEILRDRDAPPWFSLETITYGGRCVWWSTHCHSDFLDAKGDGAPLDGISMCEEMKYYIGPNPLWSEHHYVKIILPNGSIFYADVYWCGGTDHIFFELPWSLVDADEYSEYMERCTAAMDATMH